MNPTWKLQKDVSGTNGFKCSPTVGRRLEKGTFQIVWKFTLDVLKPALAWLCLALPGFASGILKTCSAKSRSAVRLSFCGIAPRQAAWEPSKSSKVQLIRNGVS